MINYFIKRWDNLELWEKRVLIWATVLTFIILSNKSCGSIVFNP